MNRDGATGQQWCRDNRGEKKEEKVQERNTRAVAVLVVVVAGVSFALSGAALADVARWGGVHGALAWAVPVAVDAGGVAFSLAALLLRQRGERAWLPWSALAVLAAVSVVGNSVHALGGVVQPALRLGVGVAVVGVAPVVVLVAVHVLASLMTGGPTRPDEADATDVADDVEEVADGAGEVLAGMRAMRAAGATLREVGNRYGVHASTVARRIQAAG